MMKLTPIVVVAFAAAFAAAVASAQERTPIITSFDGDTADQHPKGFEFGRTGSGAPGTWIVKAEKDAPSGHNVLAQVNADTTDYRFPIAFTGPDMKDLSLSAKCKPVSGKGDQGFGLVFRLKDVDNYYVTRANALEDNVTIYHVVKGNRVQFASWNGKVKTGV